MKLLIKVTYRDGTEANFELVSKNVEAHSVLTDSFREMEPQLSLAFLDFTNFKGHDAIICNSRITSNMGETK